MIWGLCGVESAYRVLLGLSFRFVRVQSDEGL